MKKIYIFTAVLALLTVSLNAQLKSIKKKVVQPTATERVDTPHNGTAPNRANRDLSVTVGDNSSYTGYVPVYGTWFDSDAGQRNQMIYSSDLLGLPVGAQITSLKFYARSTLGFHSAPVRLSIGHTTASSFTSSSFVSSSDLSQVATVTPTTSMTELNFTFSQAFTYNGGNLLIQIDSDKGEYGSTDFYANEKSDYVGIIAYQGYSDNGLTIHDRTRYLPMATFTYMSGSNPSITVSNSNLTFKTAPGETASQTVSITGYNLTEGITATVSGDSEFSVSPTTLGTDGGNLTITYSPTAGGSHSATITLSSPGAEDVTITLNGSCVQEVTVCDGTNTNNFLPLYGYYYDAKQVNQMIYPADKLTSLVGKKITSMTFYSSHIYFYNGKYTVKVGTTSQTYFSSMARNTADLTATVASDLSATAGGTELTITFDEPFEYNGGNLLVDFEETVTGSWGSSQTSFYGENQSTNTSFNTHGSSLNSNGVYTGTNSGLRSFLPKVTFSYINNTPVHDLAIALSEPESVVAGESATITATVTNNGNQTETGYTVTISANGTTISTQTVNEALAPGATATVTAQYSTTAAQGGTTVNIAANVACTDDADATNDDATTSLQVTAQVHDLAIALSAPASVVGGNTAEITATVTNNGNQPETGYTVTISADGTTISTQTATGTLAPGATATFTAQYNTTEEQVDQTVNFAANVTCTDDAEATNNDATASTSVISMPPPENVVATPNNENQSATVTWNAPSNLPTGEGIVTETVTENFDDTSVFPSFSVGGITATVHTGSFGDWTVYEPSGHYVWGLDGSTYDHQNEPVAWQVFNPSSISWTNALAHSGSQYMLSFCDAGEDDQSTNMQATNHWLISPELSGNEQTITFWERIITTQYGSETYEVLASSTDNDPSSFSLVQSITSGETTWIQRSVTLPAGTKYFAIRHTSYDVFGLMIDDVTYETYHIETVTIPPVSYNIYLDGVLVGSVDADDPLTYTFTNVDPGSHTASVSAVYPGGIESAKVPADFFLKQTPNAPSVTSNDGTTSTTITITPDEDTDGQLTYYVIDQNGNQTQDLTFPRGASDYTVTVHAYTTATDTWNQSPEAEVTVTIPALPQTAQPTINVAEGEDAYTITATGNGTIHMYVDGQEVTQPYTAERQMRDYTITVTATAQAEGELISETTTREVTIPGYFQPSEWNLMTGTYTGNQPLSLIDAATLKPIMFADSLSAMTFDNHHPDHYNYQIVEDGNEMTSNMVSVPVHKTYSTMYGLYTKEEVDADIKRTLTANSPNVTLTYDTKNADEMYFYALSRSAINSSFEDNDIDPNKAVSKLQESNDKFSEQYSYGVLPKYNEEPAGLVKRVDRYFNADAIGEPRDYENYVPVIWTFGSRTNRRPGQANINNSYGSDIKRNTLGDVVATIEVESSDYKVKDQEGNWVYGNGVWSYNNQLYTVYTPTIYITGTPPAIYEANDGDTVTYEPYMFRAWCLYEEARDFARNPQTQLLEDHGELPAPILLDTHVKTIDLDTIGGTWEYGMDRLQWSFAAPVGLTKDDLTFAVRFYYRAVLKSDSGMPLFRNANRDGLVPDEQYLIVETTGNPDDIWTGIDDMFYDAGRVPVSTTYVNSLGQTSNRPFEGLNIIVTRYSDGTSSTVKVMR